MLDDGPRVEPIVVKDGVEELLEAVARDRRDGLAIHDHAEAADNS